MHTITAPNTWRLAQRFVWKEYRMLRELALGVIGLALVTMLFVQTVSAESVRASAVMMVAIGAAAMTAIAAAVTLFSVETEEGTAELLRILPSERPNQRHGQFLGKVAAGSGTVLAVLAVLVAIALVLAGSPPNAGAFGSQGAMVLAEAFIWALLASLLCPNPLVAAVLGIAGASLNSQLAMALTTASTMGYTLQSYQAAIPARIVLLALVGVLDVWLGLHWPRPIAVAKSAARTKSITAVQPTRRRWQTEFWRFVWQTVRQSWKTALVVLVLGVTLSGIFALVTANFTDYPVGAPIIPFLGLLFTPALLGAMVFREDQKQRQYRFVSERIGRPRTLWLARLLMWISPLVVMCVGLSIAAWVALDVSNFELLQGNARSWESKLVIDSSTVLGLQLESLQTLRFVLGFCALVWCSVWSAFALGQFCSLALRSSVLAGMLVIVISILLCAWGIVIFAWRLPSLVFMAPIGVGAMLASWLMVADWLFDRRSAWRWLWPTIAILAPAVVSPMLIPTFRISQLSGPIVTRYVQKSGISIAELTAKCEQRLKRSEDLTVSYERLAAEADSATFEKPFPEQSIAKFIELSKLDSVLHPRINPRHSMFDQLLPLRLAVLPESAGQQQKGDSRPALNLEQQLERLLAFRRVDVQLAQGWPFRPIDGYRADRDLLDWALAPGQTPERIKGAIQEIEKIDLRRPTPTDVQIRSHWQTLAVVRGDEQPNFLNRQNYPPTPLEWLGYFSNQLPGEQSRAERALEVLTSQIVDYLMHAELQLTSAHTTETHGIIKRQLLRDMNGDLTAAEMLTRTDRFNDFNSQKLNQFEHARTSYLAAEELRLLNSLPQSIREWFDVFTRCRAERVRLALIAYRLKHGEYPTALPQLSPEFMQPEQYQDPYGAGPFGYAPNGFPQRLYQDPWNPAPLDFGSPGTPVIWSMGMGEARPTLRWLVSEEGPTGKLEQSIVERDSEFAAGKPGEEVMILDSDFWNHGNFWLPLPK
jgi:hypothetical protein